MGADERGVHRSDDGGKSWRLRGALHHGTAASSRPDTRALTMWYPVDARTAAGEDIGIGIAIHLVTIVYISISYERHRRRAAHDSAGHPS